MEATESLFKEIAQSRHVRLDEVQDHWEKLYSVILRATSFSAVIHTERECTMILSLLQESTSLKKVYLAIRGTGLENFSIDGLTRAIQQSQIHHLTLNRGPFKKNIAPFLQALQHVHTLKTLKITFEPILEEYCALAEVIKKSELERFEMLGMVFLFGAPQHPQPLKDAINKLVLAIRSSSSLRTVHLREMFPESVALCLEALLNDQSKLNKLAFTCSELTDDTVRLLAKVLQTNTTLTSLQFTKCELDTSNMAIFSAGLRHNSTLQSLALNYHQSDMKDLCNALKSNTSLTTLDLSDSYATNEDCQHIADMLAHNAGLKSLFLSSNEFGDDGASVICQAMTKNSTLVDLRLGVNKYNVEGMTGVKKLLQCNNTLRSLEISVDVVDVEQQMLLLYDGLKANTSLTKISINAPLHSQLEAIQNNLTAVLEHNYALNTVDFVCAAANQPIIFVPKQLIRNRHLQSEARFKVVILSHNIARSHEALSTLPREIWVSILSSITHPGLSLKLLPEQIFSSYKIE